MINNDEIEVIVRQHIESIEKIGDHAGSSGHMGNISYKLNKFSFVEIKDGTLKINYSYSTFVETEFTYYPDNPPYEYHYEKELTLDKDMIIVSDNF